MRPQRRLRAGAAQDGRPTGGRSVGSGVEEVAGEPLEQVRLVRRRCRDGGTAPAPASRPASPRARRPRVAMLVDEVEHRLARRATTVQKDDAHGRAGRDPHAAAQAKIGSSTVPAVLDSGRPSIDRDRRTGMLRPRPEEARAVGLELAASPTVSPSTTARWAAQISRLVGDAPAPRRQQGAERPARYSVCDEQLREGRVRDVGGLAAPARARRRRSPRSRASRRPSSRSRRGGPRRRPRPRRRTSSVVVSVPSSPRELGAVLVERDVVGVGLGAARLVAGRPDLAAVARRAGRCSVPQSSQVGPRASA